MQTRLTTLLIKWPVIRDIVLFFGGLGGVAHETLVSTTDRPTLLLLFAAMMGLPAFLRQDAKNSSSDKDSDGES